MKKLLKNIVKHFGCIPTGLLIFFFIWLPVIRAEGQENAADSLSKLLVSATGIKKAEIELNLAGIYRRINIDEAIRLCEDALSVLTDHKNTALEFRALVLLGNMKVSLSPSAEIFKKYIEPARKLETTVSDPSDKAGFYQNLAVYYQLTGSEDSVEYFYRISLENARKSGDLKLIGQIERNISAIYALKGKYQVAFEYALSSLKTAESLKDSISIVVSMTRISDIYTLWRNYSLAQDYLTQALEISEKIKFKAIQAQILNGFGEIFKFQKQYDKAIDYYVRGLGYDTVRGITSNSAVFMINIGECYNRKQNPQKALPLILRALKIFTTGDYTEGIARCKSELGIAYSDMKSFTKAEQYFRESQIMANKLNLVDLIISNNREISTLYSLKGDIRNAFEYYRLYSEMKDTVFSNEKAKEINELHTQYVTQSKEQQIKLQQAEIEKNESDLVRKKLEQRILLGVIVVSVAVILLIVTGYTKIVKQRNKIQEANNILEKQEEEIKDSINYAGFIQRAILPPSEVLSANFPQHFVLLRPRDIVSGDFYWCTKIEKQTVIAAVDCTGHGVPGAFMSMLGVTLLNEIINKEYITHPGVILRRLRKEIIRGLHQSDVTGGSKDGMDLAICVLDRESMKLQFAGANNPMYLIRKGNENPIECHRSLPSDVHTLYEIKGDRMPISIFDSMNNFTLHEINVVPGDLIYIFSDGYADQFGGPDGKKLQYSNFRKLLLQHCAESLEEQKMSLEKELDDWQGNHKQVDDILVVGIRL